MGDPAAGAAKVTSTIPEPQAANVICCEACKRTQYRKDRQIRCRACGTLFPAPPDPEPMPEEPPKPAPVTVLADRVRAIRLAKGLSQKQVANRMKSPRTYISKIERQFLTLPLKSIARVAEALGVTLAEIADPAFDPQELARRTMNRGGPDEDFIASLAAFAGSLRVDQKRIVIIAAHNLAKGKPIFHDWMPVD